jgi:tetrathionate reductase subunit A
VALAMIRWIIENRGYDATFLAAANKAAAVAAKEASWSNATWLVALDAEGRPGKLVRAGDVGLAAADAPEVFVVQKDGRLVAGDPNDEKNAVTGDLLVEATLPDGTKAKSGLQVLFDSARVHSIDEWCELAGVETEDVIAVARGLARAGKRGAVDIHRGPAQHTNGFYNVFAWMSLNMLLGNYDHKGGMIVGTTYDISGSKGKKFDLAAHPGKPAALGISSIRHDLAYEKSSLFAGYPARRNWYPLSSDVYEEIIPSMGDVYPYGCKAFFLYMGAPTYALPAGHTNIEILRDTGKVPLFIANDILIGSTSMYADYIFPDLSFLERWEFQGAGVPLQHPDDFYLRGVGNLAFGEKPEGTDQQPAASDRA